MSYKAFKIPYRFLKNGCHGNNKSSDHDSFYLATKINEGISNLMYFDKTYTWKTGCFSRGLPSFFSGVVKIKKTVEPGP